MRFLDHNVNSEAPQANNLEAQPGNIEPQRPKNRKLRGFWPNGAPSVAALMLGFVVPGLGFLVLGILCWIWISRAGFVPPELDFGLMGWIWASCGRKAPKSLKIMRFLAQQRIRVLKMSPLEASWALGSIW